MPKVSVIIPTYNRAHMIGKAIKSVLKQNYSDYNVIVVDDGSTDKTQEVVESFRDKKIGYSKHTTNRGQSAARNTAIRMADSQFIAFIDSDDEWFPQKLSRQMRIVEENSKNIGIVYSGLVYKENEKNNYTVKKPERDGYLYPDILWKNYIGPIGSTIIRRDCFEKCGMFDENLPSAEDWELYMRLAKKYLIYALNEPLSYYRIHPENNSHKYKNKIISNKIIFKKYIKEIKTNPNGHSEYHRRIGWWYCKLGRVNEGKDEFINALKIYPRNMRAYLHLFCAIGGSKLYQRTSYIRGVLHKIFEGKKLPQSMRINL